MPILAEYDDEARRFVANPHSQEQSPSEHFAAERGYLEANRLDIESRFDGEFVAIVGEVVADHDPDMFALSRRTFAQFGEKAVYMPFISSAGSITRILGGPVRTD